MNPERFEFAWDFLSDNVNTPRENQHLTRGMKKKPVSKKLAHHSLRFHGRSTLIFGRGIWITRITFTPHFGKRRGIHPPVSRFTFRADGDTLYRGFLQFANEIGYGQDDEERRFIKTLS